MFGQALLALEERFMVVIGIPGEREGVGGGGEGFDRSLGVSDLDCWG